MPDKWFEDVRLAVNSKIPVRHFGRMGGIVPTVEGFWTLRRI